jgi:competence protein ComEC
MIVNEFWKIPFLRLIIPLIAGIVFANQFEIHEYFLAGFLFFLVALAIVYRPFLNHSLSYHRRWVFGIIVVSGLFFTGAYVAKKSLQYDQNITNGQYLVGIVGSPPKINPNTIKIELKIKEYLFDGVWSKTSSKILVNLEKDSVASSLEYGDLILIKGNLKEIKNAGNPSEFDYKKFLARKHIHYKSYQNTEEWKILKKEAENTIFTFAYSIREKMLGTYRATGLSGEEFGFLAALTLGVKDYLSDEIIEAYSDSGAMHVLAVSGLHVGIIFGVLNYLLFFLHRKKYLKILKAFLIIMSLWFFALITGLSPSVSRAATMISFVIIGKVSGKKPSTYNSVAASAFILLFINPQSLYNVGFQLSYLAVIAIIFFQQRIYGLWDPKNRFIDKIWELTSVSIAAQIGTTAISIYYFHQFPVYAFISNIFVIPAAFIIMILAIALLASSFMLPVAKIIAWLLSKIIFGLNYITKFIDSLPFSSIEQISLNNSETLIIHISLILLMIFIITKNQKLLFPILACFTLAFALRDVRFIKNKNTETFTVYNVSRKSAFSVMKDGKLKLYTDSTLFADKNGLNYLTSNIMASNFISMLSLYDIDKYSDNQNGNESSDILNNLIQLDTIRALYLKGDYSRYQSDKKLKINFLVLSRNAPMDIEPLQNLFQFELLIADGSVPKWKQEVLKRDCDQMGIPFYNVSESGAFVFETLRYSDK